MNKEVKEFVLSKLKVLGENIPRRDLNLQYSVRAFTEDIEDAVRLDALNLMTKPRLDELGLYVKKCQEFRVQFGMYKEDVDNTYLVVEIQKHMFELFNTNPIEDPDNVKLLKNLIENNLARVACFNFEKDLHFKGCKVMGKYDNVIQMKKVG